MMFREQGKTVIATKPHKAFAWSWSRVKNFETCARRYEGIDLTKEYKQDTSDALDEGERLHKAMAARVGSDKPLPREFYYMEHHAVSLSAVTHPLQIVNCELKLAIDKSYRSVGFMERGVWGRCVIDYIKIIPSDKKYSLAHIVDYKTGKLTDDDAQLIVNAKLVFSCFKDIVGIKSEFLWTKYNDTRSITFTRKSIDEDWATLLPRIAALEQAHIAGKFPAKPGRLCKEWCVIDSCEHFGGTYK